MERVAIAGALFFLVPALIRALMVPFKLARKLLIHSGGGFLCLWILNWSAGLTGIALPINCVSAAVAGIGGLPGMAVLALLQRL